MSSMNGTEKPCEHSVGHPDPLIIKKGIEEGWWDWSMGIHGCDGCCHDWYDDIDFKGAENDSNNYSDKTGSTV